MSKILSLCSGYGGLDLAVEEHFTGSHTAYWSDIDPSACDIMTARFPDAKPVGDLTQFGDTAFDCDILTAGYPCQPFSHAGKRLGEDDERHLWPYIANTISVSRPRWVILENVANHANIGAPAVIASLVSYGYSVRWIALRASDAGAPHKRKRLFIVANLSGAKWGNKKHEHLETPTRSTTESGERTSEVRWGRYDRAIRRWERTLGRPAPDPITDGKLSPSFVEWFMGCDKDWVCGVVPKAGDALRILGNGVVKQQARLALELICDE